MGVVLIVLLSVLAATAPILGYLMVVWWMDRYEREPVRLVGLTYLWGATGAVVLGVAGSLILDLSLSVVFGITGNTAIDLVMIAPLVEEVTKGTFLLIVFLGRDFDNTTDGIVYGAATGLGFATTENFLYFVSAYIDTGVGIWVWTVLVRTLFSGVMHCVASATFGAALAYAKFPASPQKRWWFPVCGLLVGMAIHASFNGALLLGGATGSRVPVLVAFLGIPLLAAALASLMQLSLRHESRTIAQELIEESALGIIPEKHLKVLPSYFLRLGSDWLPRSVDKHRYIPLATRLAMRKFQRRRVPESAIPHYNEEITRLRSEIRNVLGR